MATAVRKRATVVGNETRTLQKEIVSVLLKKTGIKLDDLYSSARKQFVVSNLDLLTATELKKFDKILL